METLRSNVNNMTNYPDKETMELFLKIWYKKGLFDTVNINTSGGKTEKYYRNVNAITSLAVICDYLNKHWKENEKLSFLNRLENSWDEFYKEMSELALDIFEKKENLSAFSQALIKSNRERLENVKSDIKCFPTLSPACLPGRYSSAKANRMIHEEFEAELARLNWISKWADKIQAETKNHKFSREDNSKKINDLENRL